MQASDLCWLQLCTALTWKALISMPCNNRGARGHLDDDISHHLMPLVLTADRYLKQADLAECGRQQQAAGRIRDLEATVAQRVGISMLYTSSHLQMQPSYLHFLERLADGAATQGSLG